MAILSQCSIGQDWTSDASRHDFELEEKVKLEVNHKTLEMNDLQTVQQVPSSTA